MNRRDEAVKEGPPALCKDAFQDGSRTGSRHKVPDLFIHIFLFNPFLFLSDRKKYTLKPVTSWPHRPDGP